MKARIIFSFIGLALIFLMTRSKKSEIPVFSAATNYKTTFWTTGGPPPDEIADGEYYHLIRRHDSVFDGSQGIPVYLANNAIHVFAGAHNAGYIDASHVAHIEGDNGGGGQGTNNSGTGVYGFQTVSVDSLGNTLHFSDIQFGEANTAVNGSYWWGAGISYDDSSVKAWGILIGGICGNGTACALRSQAPVTIPLPGGEKAVQIQVGYYLLIRCLSGNVYAVGGGGGGIVSSTVGHGSSPNFNVPVLLSLPAPATLIAGGGLWSYAILNNNTMYAWGSSNHLYYFTLPYGSSSQNTPRNITSALGFSPSAITSMAVNNEATYVTLSDGTMRDWGSNAQGALGNGYELNFAAYGGYPLPYGTSDPFPYAYAQDYNEGSSGYPTGLSLVIQIAPINPTPGKTNWLLVHGNPCGYRYQQWARDANGDWFFAGRDKGSCTDGVVFWSYTIGTMQQRYPNSLDKKHFKKVNPFGQSTNYQAPSPDCLPSGTQLWSDACALYSPGSHTAPSGSLVLSTIQIGGHWAIIADNSASTTTTWIMDRVMYQSSGPHTLDMGVQDQPKDTILTAGGSYLTPGDTYGLHAKIINNYFDSTVVAASITIPNTSTPPYLTFPRRVQIH